MNLLKNIAVCFSMYILEYAVRGNEMSRRQFLRKKAHKNEIESMIQRVS